MVISSISLFFFFLKSCFAGKKILQKERKKEKKREIKERERYERVREHAQTRRDPRLNRQTHRERRVYISLSLSLSREF